MKKLLLFTSVMMLSIMSVAQFSGTISGTVTNNSGTPVNGIAVFNLGAISQISGVPSKEDIIKFQYANANGVYTINYQAVRPVGDTIVIGIMDCADSIYYDFVTVQSSGTLQNPTNVNFGGICRPNDCDVVKWLIKYPSGANTLYYHSAIPLIDSSAMNAFPIYEWSINSTTRRNGLRVGLGYGYPDTLNTIDSTAQVCYKVQSNCAPSCFGNVIPPTPLVCNAFFYVDTVNSINFQGQIVLWNNSSTDTGATIVSYAWDFGDGNTSNLQYPSHNYLDTGVYNVCLTITSLSSNGLDTCIDTFCTNIGFDANGNFIYKTGQQGFTINVMDPASVGQEEFDLDAQFSLYPNPSSDKVQLNWEADVHVTKVEVISMSGQTLHNLEPKQDQQALEIRDMQPGVYFIRIISDKGVSAMRMLVE